MGHQGFQMEAYELIIAYHLTLASKGWAFGWSYPPMTHEDMDPACRTAGLRISRLSLERYSS